MVFWKKNNFELVKGKLTITYSDQPIYSSNDNIKFSCRRESHQTAITADVGQRDRSRCRRVLPITAPTHKSSASLYNILSSSTFNIILELLCTVHGANTQNLAVLFTFCNLLSSLTFNNTFVSLN